jgi:hypothetical protein
MVSSRYSTTTSHRAFLSHIPPSDLDRTNLPRLTTTAAIGAAALYYITSSEDPSKFPASLNPSANQRKEAATAGDGPKPVEDRHGDTVEKHSIAAHKNQEKVREGKFSGKEFKNDVLAHTPGAPGGDFEKKS